MSFLSSISFGAPFILIALTALPVIWWLLRVTPPSPKRVQFPAVRLLLEIDQADETPAHTPWWLLLLRLLVAGLVIVALADPFISPEAGRPGSGPLVIVVDNGWASASRWEERATAMRDLAQSADRAGRPVIVLPTAQSDTAPELRPVAGADAQGAIKSVAPQPYNVDRLRALEALKRLNLTGRPDIAWLADGIDDGQAQTFLKGLGEIGTLTVYTDPQGNGALALTTPVADGTNLSFRVLRAETGPEQRGTIRATAADGRFLGSVPFSIPQGQRATDIKLDLPSELRNALARIEVADRSSASTVVLIDERWRRRPVGMFSGQTVDTAQPLLSDLYYLERALQPYAEIRKGPILDLIKSGLAVLIVTDVGQIVGESGTQIAEWVAKGGVLIRFSGPKLAAQSDELIPGKLRTGGRQLGSALSWEKPQSLAPFGDGSPFLGLTAPADVLVQRQVLTETVAGTAIESWAQLADSTPLVTAERRGKGLVVLYHVTANSEWSNLPLSGLFVDMLRRIVALSSGVTDLGAQRTSTAMMLPPVETLDGYGRFVPPPGSSLAISANEIETINAGPQHPPGLYGEGGVRRALNLFKHNASLRPLPPLPAGIQTATLGARAAMEFKFWLLAAALALLIVDGFAALALRGLIDMPRMGRAPATAAGMVLALGFAALVMAQTNAEASEVDTRPALSTHLAYVITGDAQVDQMSKAGLQGLTRALRERTAVEPADPIGINLDTDELAFYPLIYWAIHPGQPDLSAAALAKIDKYMKQGGTIFFDTRDQDLALGAGRTGPGTAALRRLMRGLDLPPVEALTTDHVLTKTFYLLQDFPGRWDGGKVWVEAHGAAGGGADTKLTQSDGVSPLVIGSHDWAAAWARDEFDRPLAAVSPGGDMQREIAVRFGINLVMYALTGNYKTDQVHVPAILERLGQ